MELLSFVVIIKLLAQSVIFTDLVECSYHWPIKNKDFWSTAQNQQINYDKIIVNISS